MVALQSSLSSSSCELVLKFELSDEDSQDGGDTEDVQQIPAFHNVSLG